MNISKQLKNYRKEFSISQEDLAEVVHVSRQTISNWENDKSYPDLQSLVLLSEYFKISLDELVKGDVVNMKNELERNEMEKHSVLMMVGCILMILSIPLVAFVSKYMFIGTIICIVMMFWSAFKVEKIKKNKNIQTYKQIVAYMEGKEIPEGNSKSKITQVVFYMVASGIITFLAVYILMKLMNYIF